MLLSKELISSMFYAGSVMLGSNDVKSKHLDPTHGVDAAVSIRKSHSPVRNNTHNCLGCDDEGPFTRCEKARDSLFVYPDLPFMATGPFDDYNGQASCDIESSNLGFPGSTASITRAAEISTISSQPSPAWQVSCTHLSLIYRLLQRSGKCVRPADLLSS